MKKSSKRSIEEIAANLGGKVVTAIKGTNAYLLEFPYDNAALLARDALLRDDSVAGTDFNYRLSGPAANARVPTSNRPLSIKPEAVRTDRRISWPSLIRPFSGMRPTAHSC